MRAEHFSWSTCHTLADLLQGSSIRHRSDDADIVTTTVHKTLRGPRSALIFSKKDAVAKAGSNLIGSPAVGTPLELDKKIDRAVFPGLQGGPHVNQIAAVAVALREAAAPAFKKYAIQVRKMPLRSRGELTRRGWRVISGGTDSHLVLVDTWQGGERIMPAAEAFPARMRAIGLRPPASLSIRTQSRMINVHRQIRQEFASALLQRPPAAAPKPIS